MSDPNDHSQSGFEPRGEPGSGSADEAQRFWGEYARRTRPGRGTGRSSGSEAGNGHGSVTESAHECLEWCPICRTADLVRASAPPELRDQIQSLQHDALVTLRGVIDAYLDRSQSGHAQRGGPVENIPID